MSYKIYHSQYGEDLFLDYGGHLKLFGTFVDVGAGHPLVFSNTYNLERNGWSGLCVDADPRNIPVLREHRKLVEHAAIIDTDDKEVELHQCSNQHLSTLGTHLDALVPRFWYGSPESLTTVKVPATTLESLLLKHEIGKIDLLSIDTEGTELQVCKSFDWEKHRPDVVIVEHTTCECEPNTPALMEFFTPKYNLLHVTPCNLLFKRVCHVVQATQDRERWPLC